MYRQCTVLLYTHTQRETHTEEGINSAAIHYAPFLLWTKRGDSRGRSREREREREKFSGESASLSTRTFAKASREKAHGAEEEIRRSQRKISTIAQTFYLIINNDCERALVTLIFFTVVFSFFLPSLSLPPSLQQHAAVDHRIVTLNTIPIIYISSLQQLYSSLYIN